MNVWGNIHIQKILEEKRKEDWEYIEGGGGGGEARAMIRAMTEAKWRRSWLKGVWSDDKCSMANSKGRVEGEHNTVRGLASQD